jgi:hypothetical protein
MFAGRKVRYSALFTNFVGWHPGAVNCGLRNVILAQQACPLSDIMFWLHSRITYLYLYNHCLDPQQQKQNYNFWSRVHTHKTSQELLFVTFFATELRILVLTKLFFWIIIILNNLSERKSKSQKLFWYLFILSYFNNFYKTYWRKFCAHAHRCQEGNL